MKSKFRGITVREVALIKGPYGWGEFSPFLEYEDEESAHWLASAVEAATTPRPQLFRTVVPVNGTIPALNDPAQLQEIVTSFPGVKSFKVKVGENLVDDVARVNLIRQLQPEAKIRVDANGLWSVEQAVEFLKLVGEIEYIEQPCVTIEELRELKSKTSVKIVADEVLRKASDPFEVNLAGAVDYLMLKV
ncbi:MAG: O-succinylbenzoate synthase, partial [Candidatus Planktophila sp.]|nr:O-succinylbenzoate synthase [Candidatus Planktophila sp.]